MTVLVSSTTYDIVFTKGTVLLCNEKSLLGVRRKGLRPSEVGVYFVYFLIRHKIGDLTSGYTSIIIVTLIITTTNEKQPIDCLPSMLRSQKVCNIIG